MTSPSAAPRPPISVAEAKAALRTWGDENQAKADALRTHAATGFSRLAMGGGITFLAVALIHRLIPRRGGKTPQERPRPRRTATWLRLLTFARIGRWAMPHVLNALKTAPRAGKPPESQHAPHL